MKRQRTAGTRFVSVVFFVGIVLAAAPALATLTEPAAPWPADSAWIPFTVANQPVIDAEGGLTNDSSNGGKRFSGATDIASGWDLGITGPCTNVADTQCGTQTSAFTYYDNQGTAGTGDDVLYFRLRINGDPREGVSFIKHHWNVLIDVQGTAHDGYKDLWVDVFGGFNDGKKKPDQLRILYEDNGSNSVTNDKGAGGSAGCGGSSTAGGTFIDSFIACAAAGVSACRDGSGNDLSHTRVIDIGDGSGDFYVDVQVPVAALTDNGGCYSGPTKLRDREDYIAGTPLFTDTTGYTVLFSTSNAAKDPLRKDLVPSDFGDVSTTPVTLASFDAERTGAGIRFEWTTSTETANVGFDIYERTETGWRRLNRRLVPSHSIDSTAPQHYEYTAPEAAGTVFKIVDVSTTIRRRGHGPFELGRVYGHPAEANPIDWGKVRREHQAQAEVRRVARQRRAARVVRASEPTSVAGAARIARSSTVSEGPICELHVTKDGIYRVTSAELAAAGFDLSGVRLSDLALTHRGRSVPIRVSGERGRLGASGYIEFLGKAEESPYTRTNVYQLGLDRRHAARVQVVRQRPPKGDPQSSYTEQLRVNADNGYMFFSPSGDPWYDTRFLAYENKPVTKDFDFQVDHLADGPTQLDVDLWGVTDWPQKPDHHVKVLFNGSEVANLHFDGTVNVPLTIPLPAGALHNGDNTLRFELPGDAGVRFDMVNLDTYGVRYPRKFVARDDGLTFSGAASVFEVGGFSNDRVEVYRVTDSRHGARVAWYETVDVASADGAFAARFAGTRGGRTSTYTLATTLNLLTPEIVPARASVDLLAGPADYLVISHPDFLGGLAPLVQAREAQGWTVKVVDVNDVYQAYSGGIFDPHAIQAYIADAAHQLGVRAVLLVGGDTYDYLDHLGLGSVSFIPTLYTNTRWGATFSPSDALMADIDGDRVPDVAIGRLPVRTSAELAAEIRKILDYEKAGHALTAVFAADGDEDNAPFTEQSEALASRLPQGWQVSRAFIDTKGLDGARAELLGALNGGVSLTTYVGHSGPNSWTFDGLFTTQDASSLTNSGMPTIVSQWGCWNTYFVDPEADTMAHALMLDGDRGAAAVVGATTITTVDADAVFAPLLQDELVQPGVTVGEAILRAKKKLAQSHPEMNEVILGTTLLGDPGLVVTP